MKREGGVPGKARGARLGDVLGAFLEEKGLAPSIERQGVLLEWPAAVGEAIAGVTAPRSITGQTLVVEVRSSPWLMELNLMKREILARLNEGRGDAPIEKLVFVLAETR
jgi:predicted nucleic acid-binding Zn ribbon protein